MFVINPDPYSLPAYRIGPFRTQDLTLNHLLTEKDKPIKEYLDQRFKDKTWSYTENGRQAIFEALKYFNLKPEDVVTILTTSGNFYISGCVTKEIEKFCRWSREMQPETRLIFVNHEFGYPFKKTGELKKYNLPIIEDCAGSFFSEDPDGEIGNTGDFVIYSFPKMFPLQIGGLLVAKKTYNIIKMNFSTPDVLLHVQTVLSEWIGQKEEIIRKRLFNYNFLKTKFLELGLVERFMLEPGTVPGVFMFRTDNYNLDLPELKKHYYAHGVQCSVFYGEKAFFIPVHQALTEQDLLYFTEIMKAFLKEHALL